LDKIWQLIKYSLLVVM